MPETQVQFLAPLFLFAFVFWRYTLMQHSESIANLAAALSKAQGEIDGARKHKANPFFNSKYADLAEIWDACREALGANGLAVAQFPVSSEQGVGVETMLMHSSGEWLSQEFFLPISENKKGEANAQGGGSCITYARRYALAAVVGVCPEDDDGNAAASNGKKPAASLYASALPILEASAKKGMPTLESAWKALSNDERAACKGDLDRLKKEAQRAAVAV